MLRKFRKKIRTFNLKVKQIAFGQTASNFECVICKRPVAGWRPYRSEGGPSPFIRRLATVGSNAERFACEGCHSNDRERHLMLFFNKLDLWKGLEGKAILHFAPERHIADAIMTAQPANYVRGDLFPANESIQKINIEAIPYPDAAFDLVICNHILEHVSNVEAALAEVRRVLKVGGRFICQTPYSSKLSRTFEEPALQDTDDRLFFYGQNDHVRLFGTDIEARLHAAGFAGRLVPHDEILPQIDPVRWGVNEREPFFDFVRI